MTDELDDFDHAILAGLRRMWNETDPPPPDLDTRVLFALDIAEFDSRALDIEVARLREEALAGSGARASERTRTITFDCESLSVMVSIVPGDSGIRVDGWLAPPGRYSVELRTLPGDPDAQGVSYVVQADEGGRFVFPDVPHGLAQLLVTGFEGGRTVVTPSIVL